MSVAVLSIADYDRHERNRMPPALRRAELVLSEQDLTCDVPVGLHARFDQVFLCQGTLVLLETKRRARLEVEPSDVLQLSAQRTVLRHTTDARVRGVPVSSQAFVRIVCPDQPACYVPVALVGDETVVAYYHRYQALRRDAVPEGQMPLRGAYDRRVCSRCTLQLNCSYKRS